MMNFEENFLPSKPYFPYFNTDQMIWGLRKFCLREIFLFCGARYRTESWWSVVSTWSSILVAHPVDKVSRESPEIWSFHFCIVFFSPLSLTRWRLSWRTWQRSSIGVTTSKRRRTNITTRCKTWTAECDTPYACGLTGRTPRNKTAFKSFSINKGISTYSETRSNGS